MFIASENGAGRPTPSRVASLHETASGSSLVVVGSESDGVRVLCAERLSTGDRDGVRRLMSTHRAERLVRVIPTDQAIVRCVTLPAGEAEATRAAIGLMAEAQLPAAIEPHRRGAGLLPLPGQEEGQRVGLLAGWHGVDVPEQILAEEEGETWTPASAGLCFLLGLDAQRDWHRDPAWGAADAGQQACAAVVASASGTRVRAGRIGSARSVIEEMHPGAAVAGGRSVGLDDHTLGSLRGIAPNSGVDGAWVDHHAVAVGAALGALLSGDGLFRIMPEPPRYHYTFPQRAALWAGSPRTVRAFIALGLLLIFAAPVALVYARHEMLKVKLENAQANLGAEAQAEMDTLVRDAAYAKELLDERIPYSKYIGTIADAMPIGPDAEQPLGVQLERIDISSDRINLRGEASTRQVVLEFQNKLASTGLFGSIRPDTKDEANSGRVTFTMTAEFGSRERRPQYQNRYATEPFAVLLYGEDARDFDYASLDTMGGEAGATGRSNGRPSGSSRTAGFDDNAGETATDPIPEVLGADKIEAMDFAEARAAFAERRRAASRSDIDDATKELLAEDVELLRNHLRNLRD